jgi:hypothetical protein
MVKGGSKLEKELKEEDGTVLLPVESVPEVSVSVAKKSVKRVLTEKQQENAKRLGEASKARWEKLREEKARLKAEEEEKKKAEEKALIDAGTHVRVRLKEKKVMREKPSTPMAPKRSEALPKKNPVLRRQKAYEREEESDSESQSDFGSTETEEDTDVEEAPRSRTVRREIKKNVKALERVDAVLSTVQNPYLSMLASKWR